MTFAMWELAQERDGKSGDPGRPDSLKTEAGFTGPITLGNPSESSMLQLAENVLRMAGSKSKLTFKPLPLDGPKQRQPNIALIKEKQGWEPKVHREDGLKENIDYFKRLLNV